LLAGKTAVGGRAALYVCRDFACQRPVTEPQAVAAVLAADAVGPREGSLGAEPLSGCATAEATAALAARQAPAVRANGYRPFGSTGLTASIAGFGGYRIDEGEPEHAEALRRALQRGCNVVDTSTNYMDGGSERLIGQLLAELQHAGTVRRDEVIVVSKAGYVQAANLEIAEAREQEGRPYPDVVKYAEGIWHCIHPEFLQDQLTASLERLDLATLDVCLLHNPEYYLKDAHERSYGTLEKRREEFYRRLAESFAYLEAEVAGGRLRWYGVSSNTVAGPATDPESTSLARMLEAARAAGGDGHHFRVLQLPLNLLEGLGATETVQAAAAAGVAVLVNRPLNAMSEDSGMVRLAEVPVPEAPGLQEQARVVADHEGVFRTQIASRLRAAEGGVPPEDLFRWGDELAAAAEHVQSLEHWEQVEQQRIYPQVAQVLQALDRALTGPAGDEWRAWRGSYLPELQSLLAACRRLAAQRSAERSASLAASLDPALPEERRPESLSRKAIWIAASTPGVTTVLVGMRRPQYVEDALAVMEWPRLDDTARAYEAVSEAKV
jgi:aryl-alcohol dehydrogenase-like predicted oxidoreductase